MKWTNLQMTNFLNHADTNVDLTRVNIFVGPNGAGKTAIRDGLQWVITGLCRGMTKKKDHAAVIRQGAKEADGCLEFEKGDGPPYRIHRRCTPSNTTLVFGQGDKILATGLQESQDKIYEMMGVTAEMAERLFDVFSIPTMSDPERKKLLQRFFSTEGTGKLMEYLVEKGFGSLPTEYREMILAAYRNHGLGTDTKGAYGYVVGKRREYKRHLGELAGPTAPEVSEAAKNTGQAKLREVLALFEQQKADVLQAESYDAGKVESTKGSIQRLEEEQAKIEGMLVDEKEIKAQIESVRQQYEDAEYKSGEATHSTSDSEDAELLDLKITADTLQKMGVAVSQKSIKAVQAKTMVLKMDPKEQSAADDEEIVAAAREAFTQAQTLLRETQEKAQFQIRQLDLHQRNQSILDGFKADLAQLEKQPTINPQEREAKIKDAELGITQTREALDQCIRLEEYERLNKEVATQRKALTGKIASWDNIAKALDPKNPDLKVLMGSMFGTFQEMVRNYSEALGVPATVNDDFSIEAHTQNAKTPLTWVSHSEAYRVGIAIESALCAVLGIRSMIIDEGETLHGKAKQDLNAMLMPVSNYFDCVVVLATGNLPTNGSPAEGVIVRGVQEGKVLDA